MTITYLLTLNLPDDSASTLIDTAHDLEDDLETAGHDVESVKPWNRSSLVGGAISSAPPTQTLPPPPNPFA